ncbi:hypothetical protein E0H75_26160 [Kribbella capetownensis]|uniref:Uncharacterized protein n=1 Tax=Kribbella capetownensis TaxID=1572659 RepID=A0A4R0JJS2_9ACTN|nr:hypothetical protein [Kribbella capetownensis]TCC46547.1 hypothetical protein E0H75_26160 [Kribbella capetownensis]
MVGERLAAPQRDLSPLAGRGLNGFSEDFTRPLLLGYLRRDLLVTDSQVGELKRDMAAYAEAENVTMGHIYVEQPDSWLSAFEALVDSASRYTVSAVVLPSLLHFVGIGMRTDRRGWFEETTGARVLVLNP